MTRYEHSSHNLAQKQKITGVWLHTKRWIFEPNIQVCHEVHGNTVTRLRSTGNEITFYRKWRNNFSQNVYYAWLLWKFRSKLHSSTMLPA